MLIRLAEPYFLVLLLALLPVIYWHLRTLRRQEPRLQFSTLAIAGRLRPSRRQLLRPTLDALRVLTLMLLVVALARPTISRAAETAPGTGIDIVLALDTSFSMADRDLGPKSRLESAKDVIREFVGGRSGDRIGLVAFAAEAVTISPLTLDYPILLGILDEVDHGRLPEGTAIGNGLATAINLLRDAQGKSRVVILLTDGQNNSGQISPASAARMAQVLKLRAYTIGVGAATTRANPRNPDGGFGFGREGIDEKTLREISETTGASYFRAVDADALKQVYELIGRLEKTETGAQKYAEILDLSGYLLLAAGIALLAEAVLRNSWFRRAP